MDKLVILPLEDRTGQEGQRLGYNKAGVLAGVQPPLAAGAEKREIPMGQSGQADFLEEGSRAEP